MLATQRNTSTETPIADVYEATEIKDLRHNNSNQVEELITNFKWLGNKNAHGINPLQLQRFQRDSMHDLIEYPEQVKEILCVNEW